MNALFVNDSPDKGICSVIDDVSFLATFEALEFTTTKESRRQVRQSGQCMYMENVKYEWVVTICISDDV